MKTFIFISIFFLASLAIASEKNETRFIQSGKKEAIKCAERNTHLFCNVKETFDTPGTCGQGFDCILMKTGDIEKVCAIEFQCVK